jgi:D-sedoheptulose 7-phosphate isomerase
MHSFATQLLSLQTALKSQHFVGIQGKLDRATHICFEALSNNRPVLVCGNGGSAADAQHIAGELVGRFLKERRALNVRALTADTSILTAWANDYSYETVFARQVEAYGSPGGVLLALTTSGNSKNVLVAAEQARKQSMQVIALTGEGGGKLTAHCDVLLDVPSRSTPRIQEMHLMLYHYLCESIETRF